MCCYVAGHHSLSVHNQILMTQMHIVFFMSIQLATFGYVHCMDAANGWIQRDVVVV